jgi:hypothetical protein
MDRLGGGGWLSGIDVLEDELIIERSRLCRGNPWRRSECIGEIEEELSFAVSQFRGIGITTARLSKDIKHPLIELLYSHTSGALFKMLVVYTADP